MVHTLAMLYAVGLVAGSVGAFVVTEQLQTPRAPVWPRAMVSVAAGSLWPVLAVGAVQLGSLRAYAKLARRRIAPVIDLRERFLVSSPIAE